MKLFALFLLSLSLLAAQSVVKITSYRFTAADCSPMSMLMLFPPYPGFTCTPSTTLLISSTDQSISGYAVEVIYQQAGSTISAKLYLPATNGEAMWVIGDPEAKIVVVQATPQIAKQTPIITTLL